MVGRGGGRRGGGRGVVKGIAMAGRGMAMRGFRVRSEARAGNASALYALRPLGNLACLSVRLQLKAKPKAGGEGDFDAINGVLYFCVLSCRRFFNLGKEAW